jgi:hypothetical protein
MVETTDSDRLLKVLDDLEQLLLQHGENFWGEWINSVTTRIRNGDGYGPEELLGFYGGMGSLNDLIICPENGHRIEKEDEAKVNAQLKDLLEQASSIARELLRQHQAKIQ